MHTRCPSCETIFRLAEDEITISSDMVRCCVCRGFFNALENRSPEAGQQPPAHVDLLVDKSRDLATNDLSAALGQFQAEDQPAGAPWWSTLVWVVLILTVLAAALGQLAWFNREKLLLQAELKPHIQRLCERLDCRLQPAVDLQSIELLSRDVRSHPAHEKALLITSTFINRAAFAQPYPNVGLTLSDIGGNVVAQRRFKPAEYLKAGYRARELMPREVPVTLVMEAQDPGGESVSYHFDFL